MYEKKIIDPPSIYAKENNPYAIQNLINHIEKNPSHSIGFNFHSLSSKNNYIILDIDDENVGSRIIEFVKTRHSLFQKVFGNPLIIQTETAGHLHLYYKSQNETFLNQEDREKNKVKHCTRLGFPAEYTFGNITFASQKRFVLRAPVDLNCISELPPTLYPYNYYPKQDFFSLINGISYEPNSFPNSKLISEGRRNEFFVLLFKI